MPNPLIDQGTLNRLRGAAQFVDFPGLNVAASNLGKGGISLSFEGEVTGYIPTMVGAATSPEPYQLVKVKINLLRTQSLAQQFETQKQLLALLGEATIYTDSTVLPEFDLDNTSITNVDTLTFAGEDAGYVVELTGVTQINSALWDLT